MDVIASSTMLAPWCHKRLRNTVTAVSKCKISLANYNNNNNNSHKKKKQVLLTKSIVLVCSNRGRNDGGHQQRRDGLFVPTWKAHHTMYRWPPRERLPLSATIHFNSTLQCGRCYGYLHRHNPRGRNVAVPAFVLVFSLVFSPRYLYYRKQ